MADDINDSQRLLTAVPLFPLPNVVLFPRAILPLHIFEERYKAMTADALSGGKQIAMALLRPGWEKNYHGNTPIEPVVCVGQIMAHERLPDGKYNFLLQGMSRARIVREFADHAYRTADLQVIAQPAVMEIDLCNHRRQLISIFSNGRFSGAELCEKFLDMLSSPMPTSDIADLISFNFLDDTHVKQQLLVEADPRRRLERVVGILERLQTLAGPIGDDGSVDPNMN